jgi:HK97 family phage major capsid protein
MDITERVKALNEAKIKASREELALMDAIKPGDTRTAEQVEQLDRIDATIKDIDDQVRRLVANEQRETEAAKLRENDERNYGQQNAQRREQREQDTLRAWIAADPNTRGDLEVNIRAAAKERQMLRQGASHEEIRNAITWDTGSIASAVPVTMSRSLYEYMEAGIAAFRIGASQVTTSTGENIDFPRLNAHSIATQVAGQGTALAGTDPTFLKLTLGAKKYGQLVRIANEALRDPVFDVAGFLGRDMGRGIARLADGDLVNGTGGITGGLLSSAIVGAAGTVATGGTVANLLLAYPALVSTVYGVNEEYRTRGAWLMRDATAGALRQIRDGGGGTIGAVMWEPSLTNGLINGQPDRFLGYPVYTDPNVASLASNARIAAFGDFSSYYLRTVGNVQIDSSTERFFDTDETGFRAKWQLDGGYIDLTAVVLLKNSVA